MLQGYGPAVTASDLAEAAYAVQAGATWVATNTDGTLPTDRGVAPGNGSLVAAVERAVGTPPHLVAGKPAPPLYLLCAQRLDLPAGRLLAVGDRLDTDIEGAVAAGMDSLLVLTGVDDLRACLEAPAHRRPTWVAPDLRALLADPDEAGGLSRRWPMPCARCTPRATPEPRTPRSTRWSPGPSPWSRPPRTGNVAPEGG